MIHQSGTREISRLRVASPGIALSFVVFALGIVGIPPLNGFVSKFIICYGAVKAQYEGLALVILIASIISCGYYFRVVQTFFSKREKRERMNRRTYRISRWITIPVYILAVLCVALGLFPSIGLKAADLALGLGGG